MNRIPRPTEQAQYRLEWMRDALDAFIDVMGIRSDGGLRVLIVHRDPSTSLRCPFEIFDIPGECEAWLP